MEEISKIMQGEASKLNDFFPPRIISNVKEHSRKENILKEIKKSNFIGLVSEENGFIIGFAVGYTKDSFFLDYVWAMDKKTKVSLVTEFEKECRKNGFKKMTTEAYEFMENRKIYEEMGYKETSRGGNPILIKYEKIMK